MQQKNIKNFMKFLATATTAMLAMALALSISCVMAEGTVEREEREIAGFTGISMAANGNIQIQQGEIESLVIEGSRDNIDRIETFVDDGTLVIKQKPRFFSFLFIRPTKLYLTVKDLNEITIAGSGDISCDELNADKLKINIMGSGDISLGLTAETLITSIEGSGDVDLSGEVPVQKISINGSGDYNAKELVCQDCEINVNGSGDVSVNVIKNLDIKIAGSGDVSYKGSPKVNMQSAGSGDVSRID